MIVRGDRPFEVVSTTLVGEGVAAAYPPYPLSPEVAAQGSTAPWFTSRLTLLVAARSVSLRTVARRWDVIGLPQRAMSIAK